MNQARALHIVFCHWFGLTASEADLLVMLFDAPDAPLSMRDLVQRTGLTRTNINFRMHRVRAALETEAIDHVRGAGYRLTDEGRQECRAAAWQIGQELAGIR